MKITCEREKLLPAFQTAASVAPTRSPKPILQNVKFEVTQETATLMATDLELGVRLEVPGVEVEVPGNIVLPIARFLSILRETSDEKLSIQSDGRSTLVRGSRSEFRLPSENPDEFPNVGTFQEERYYKMPARFFREVVKRTVFATDPESSRYALGGVLLELAEDKLTAVGTDGRRLARQEGPVRVVGGGDGSGGATIVPSRAMQLLDRALGDNDGDIQLAAHSNDVMVKSGRAMIFTRLVEGRFPRWRDVFPRRENAIQIEMVAGPFYATVRQAAIVASEDRRGVDFTFGEGKVLLTCRGAEAGESRVELPIPYDGTPVPITLDPRYVSDFLKVLNPDQTFQMELQDSESAAVCRTEDGYAYVIMPLARDH